MKKTITDVFNALSDGVEKVGKAIQKSGLANVLFMIWCLFWGFIMIPITIFWLFTLLLSK